MALRAKVGCLAYLWPLIISFAAVSFPADAANQQTQDSTSQAATPVSGEADQALPPLVEVLPVNKERIKKFLAVLTALEAEAPADSAGASEARAETSTTESQPFTEMISDEKVRESVDVLAKEQTFEDAQAWAQFGDRLSILIGLVEMIKNEGFKQGEIDAVRKSQTEIRAAFDEDVK